MAHADPHEGATAHWYSCLLTHANTAGLTTSHQARERISSRETSATLSKMDMQPHWRIIALCVLIPL